MSSHLGESTVRPLGRGLGAWGGGVNGFDSGSLLLCRAGINISGVKRVAGRVGVDDSSSPPRGVAVTRRVVVATVPLARLNLISFLRFRRLRRLLWYLTASAS